MKAEHLWRSCCETPLGTVLLTADEIGLTGLWFVAQKYLPGDLASVPECSRQDIFCDTERWLSIYFSGRDPGFLPQLHPVGSEFRMRVWKHLLEIPRGKTVTYGQLASQLAEETGRARMSAQAIGGAVGHNPIGILIPCHRVIGADGSLTGYAGGLDRKRTLLSLEGVL